MTRSCIIYTSQEIYKPSYQQLKLETYLLEVLSGPEKTTGQTEILAKTQRYVQQSEN